MAPSCAGAEPVSPPMTSVWLGPIVCDHPVRRHATARAKGARAIVFHAPSNAAPSSWSTPALDPPNTTKRAPSHAPKAPSRFESGPGLCIVQMFARRRQRSPCSFAPARPPKTQSESLPTSTAGERSAIGPPPPLCVHVLLAGSIAHGEPPAAVPILVTPLQNSAALPSTAPNAARRLLSAPGGGVAIVHCIFATSKMAPSL